MNNITTKGWLDFTDLKYFPPGSVDMDKYDLRPGDILFNRTNSKELVGKPGLWEEAEGLFTFASYIIRLRLRADAAVPEYIWALLNSPYGKQQVFSISKQAVNMANINTQELGSIQIVLPPLSLQKQFATYLRATRDQLKFSSLPARHLDTLHQSLLDRTFTGELTATWRAQHAEELAQAARERDHLLMQMRLAPAELVTPTQPTRSEISERQELLELLNGVQRALLAMINEQSTTYYTANSAHEELVTIECSLDIVRRELHFLAAAGWIKEQTLPAEAESSTVRYIPVYRSLLPEDNSQEPDIDQLITRLGSEYPDEVLV
jgi:type I restriction enzyme, S subunit